MGAAWVLCLLVSHKTMKTVSGLDLVQCHSRFEVLNLERYDMKTVSALFGENTRNPEF